MVDYNVTVSLGGGSAMPSGAFNVKAYGAVGDGVTDDTVAIQAAATASAVSGGTLFFPTGTYVVSSGITGLNNSGITISGHGATISWTSTTPGEYLFAITEESSSAGVLNAANRQTGERLWRIRLKGPFSGSPVAGGNQHLYIFNEQGIGQCVDLSGEEGKIISEIELGEKILGTPSISDDALYIRSDGHLWKFAAKS